MLFRKLVSNEVMLKQMNTEILIVIVQSIVQREKIGEKIVKIYDSICNKTNGGQIWI